ncbi:MAG: hypothetical protein RL204_1842 [Bacteroidota bacterium]|jgi:hypothetical protein
MKITILTLGVILSLNIFSQGQEVDFVLHFDKASYELIESEKQKLETWALSHYHLKNEPVLLRGHTDSDADSQYNIELSKKRNATVSTFLRTNGFANITFKFFGEDWPLCNVKNENCLSQNRRVEIIILDESKEKWLLNNLEETPQVHFINPKKYNIIEGVEGTLIEFPANLFSSNSTADEEVRIELKEYYTVSKCIQNGMSTVCGDKLLESGGMIELRAFDQNQQELILNENQSYSISFKDQAEQEKDMQIFYGIAQENGVEWTTTPIIEKPEFDFFQEYYSKPNLNVKEIEFKSQNTVVKKNLNRSLNGKSSEEFEKMRLINSRRKEDKKRLNKALNAKQTGFINCDRFQRTQEVTKIFVHFDGYKNGKVSVYLPRLNAVLYGGFDETTSCYAIGPLPIGEEAFLIADLKTSSSIHFFTKKIVVEKSLAMHIDPGLPSESSVEELMATLNIPI